MAEWKMTPARAGRTMLSSVCAVALLTAAAPVTAAAPAAAPAATAAPVATGAPLQRTPARSEVTSQQYAPDRIVVQFRAGAAPTTALRSLDGDARPLGGVALSTSGPEVLRVDPGERDDVLQRLRRSGAVEYAELDPVMRVFRTPNDRFWSRQWASRRVHLDDAWDLSVGRRSTLVAVLDTGVDRRHPDLEGALLAGHDFVNGDRDPRDDDLFGHGTMVTGVIAARGDNRRGVAGACWRCRVLPVKVLDAQGGGYASDAARGLRYAVDQGAHIVNMSFGGPRGSRVLADAVDYAHRRGVLLVAAAGNSNTKVRNYPAAYPGVLAVAGSTETDARYRHPTAANAGSNYGRWVHLSAPWFQATTGPDSGYYEVGGTSFAAPAVSGVAALAKSLAPRASRVRIRQVLLQTALRTNRTRYVRHGRVEADRTLIWMRGGVPLMGDWNRDGVDTPGWYKHGWFYLTNRHSSGRSFAAFRFGGAPGDVPVVGDWDGDGRDTVGVRRGNRWFLRNANASGPADLRFRYGSAGDIPLVGNWDGKGGDGIGVRRGRRWFLRNAPSAGPTQRTFVYGPAASVPLVGDWDGDGSDGIGVRRGRRWLLRDTPERGRATLDFRLGRGRDRPVVGDYDGDRRQTPGLSRGDRWLLRNRSSAGGHHRSYPYGG